jgi:hypothetical protein
MLSARMTQMNRRGLALQLLAVVCILLAFLLIYYYVVDSSDPAPVDVDGASDVQ